MIDILKTKNADNPLPAPLTAYDLLKTLAIILMVVDHIGAYFFPDQMWWRV